MIYQGTIYPGTDGTRPSFLNWPSNINGTVPFGSSPTTVSWTEPIGFASVAAPQSSGSFFAVEYTNMVYTATDPSGNFESCSFSVTVTGTIYPGTDGTRPSFLNWPSNIDGTVPFGSSPTTVSWTEPIRVASIAAPQSSGSFFAMEYTNMVYTDTDPSGNFESCSFSVTVTGTIYPGTDGTRPSFFNWPSNINGTVPFGSSPTTISWTEPIGVASVAAPQSSGSFFAVEYTNMVYTATDPSGNFESCSFSVTVTGTIYPGTDGTRPSFLNWPSNIDGTVPFSSSPTTVSWTEPIGVASVAAPQSSGSFFAVEYTNMVYTATDPSGNFESCSFSVTVTGTIYPGTDGTRPSFLNWPSNINGTVPFGSSPTTVSWTEPIGFASVAAPQSSGSFFAVEYTNMVYTATDPSGNFESCSFSVTVTGTIYPGTDGTRPSFLNWPSNIDGTVPFGSSSTTVSWTEPIGVASVAAPQSSGSFFVVEYTNMVYTATDPRGNFESCSNGWHPTILPQLAK
ncbi:hyalin [Strongylocentrotus purpuratus]|uniref:HYR domain-containing protein n=1 Tax=Strongylocentrotus purpuratus TaxID=7668 RepID=A0A7M7PD76_STRPU|nr:hyalin [Strongylocentrotus purpuratus]